jgi:ATP-dependent DNA ligase
MRIHPAESRIRKLSAEHPALYIVFDLLVDERGTALIEHPLAERRKKLEAFAAKHLKSDGQVRLSPATDDLRAARKWFASAGRNLDGVVAKRCDADYRSGDRTGMVKVKNLRTAECVVAGFRYGSKATTTLGSLLLGLYDDAGLLHHVGFCSSLTANQRADLTPKIEKLRKPASQGGGFTGKAPGGPSRWSTERSGEWEPLDPRLVVEVQYDHFSQGRFRHGTKFLRWRPDKPAKACGMDQVLGALPSVELLNVPTHAGAERRERKRPKRRPGSSVSG